MGNPSEVTGLRSLSDAADMANAVAVVVLNVSYFDYREPGTDIAAFDAANGTPDVPDPLLTVHRLGRMYLAGAGDFLYSIGKTLELDQPMVVSPGVLARATAEYASRCKYVAEPGDTPEQRLAKLAHLMRSGLLEAGASDPTHPQHDGLSDLAARFTRWESGRRPPRVKKPSDYKGLIEDLLPGRGGREYAALSGIAHASAPTLIGVFLSAQMNLHERYSNSWRNALFATKCALSAARHVATLRGHEAPELRTLAVLVDHYCESYNESVDKTGYGEKFDPEPTP